MSELDKFIEREIAVWGSDYILDLIDKGYEPVALIANANAVVNGKPETTTRFSWRYVNRVAVRS